MVTIDNYSNKNIIQKCKCSFCENGYNEIKIGDPITKKMILCSHELGILDEITKELNSEDINNTLRFLIHYGAFHVQINDIEDVET
jgi:hypothetical protein